MKQYIDKSLYLIDILADYKKRFPIDTMSLDDVRDFVVNKKYIITGKIDGELSLIYYNKKDNVCFTMSKNGRVRTNFPLTDELRSFISQHNINELIAVGELYVELDTGEILSYPKALSILRKPKSLLEEKQIKLMIFDIINIDGEDFLRKKVIDRIYFIKKFFQTGNYFNTVTIFDTQNIDIAYEQVLEEKGWEGLVLVFDDNVRIKVKPILSVDAIVVGIEISPKNPNMMKSLKLAFMNRDGLFVFDSSVGTGFSLEERKEWYTWAEDNMVDEQQNVILVNPYINTRIVEVYVRGISMSEGPGMYFDKKTNSWVYVDNYPVGSLRQPSFIRIRDDKSPVPEDLRIEQILPPKIKQSNLQSDYISFIKDKYTYILSKDIKLMYKLAKFFNCSVHPMPDSAYGFIRLALNNEFGGFQVGDRVISLTKDIEGTIIDYEQVFCPKCQVETKPVPQYDMPRLTITFVCPECGHYLERTDVDFRIKWDEPIDGDNLYASEVHPTEIKKVSQMWLNSEVTPGNEQDIIIPPNDFYPHGITKEQVYTFYNQNKDKILQYANNVIFTVMMTDKGPVIKRHDDGEFVLTEEVFDNLNNGRNIEFHRVINDHKINYGFIDIDPGKKVPFNEVKKVTLLLYDYLSVIDNIKNVKIYFSGNRGFYLIFDLIDEVNVDTLRNNLILLCEDFIKEANLSNVSTGILLYDDFIRLDVSTLKYKGSLKLPYSMSYKTGLYVKPLTIKELYSFEKEHATIIKNTVAFKDVDVKNLVGYKGRFVIQEHFSKRQNKTHWDLRLEIPNKFIFGGEL